MKHQTFDELLQNYENALTTLGLGYSARLETLCHAGMVIKRHESKGLTWFEEETIGTYLQDTENRFYEGKITKRKYNKIIFNTDRLLHYLESGVIIPKKNLLKGSRCEILPEFKSIVDSFLASDDFHANTRNDIRWVVHKYFAWLYEQGYEDLVGVGGEQIQNFLLDCSKKHPPTSVHNIMLYLKKLYAYLYMNKLAPSSYIELLSFRVNRESKIFPALPMSDVTKLINVIDRKTKSGKRSYAAMILGAELGLRACDVINLKLDNIDWVNGEIKILQSKTHKTVVLPLTQKVGEALHDYILNARPTTNERHVFLRFNKPHTPLKAAVSIGEIYRDCCKAAGLPISKSFHTLRRSLATAMVTNGVEITDVAQVLGDEHVDSTKKYISLDTTNLKRCALTFDGITPSMNGGNA
jgi:Site-specific recombinase XerD